MNTTDLYNNQIDLHNQIVFDAFCKVKRFSNDQNVRYSVETTPDYVLLYDKRNHLGIIDKNELFKRWDVIDGVLTYKRFVNNFDCRVMSIIYIPIQKVVYHEGIKL